MFSPRAFQRQNHALAQAIQAGREGLNSVINYVIPGGGKSSLPVIYASVLIQGGVADKICWLVPRLSLAEQAASAFQSADLRGWLRHQFRIREATNDVDPSRGEAGFTQTYQALAQRPDFYRGEFQRYRYILVADEFQHLSKDWASAVLGLAERAVLVLPMSGALERTDAARLPFLDAKGLYIPDPNGRRGEIVDVMTERPDFVRYSRAQALAERAILLMEFSHLDGQASWVDTRTAEREGIASFDEIDDDDYETTREAIYSALETEYAYALLEDGVRNWLGYRRRHQQSQLIIIAHSQQRATEYARYLKSDKADPKLRTLAVGLAISDEGPEALNAIREFRERRIPILITVGMAYEGLDAPGITHLICLTHIRSRSWILQMLHRAVRVDRLAGPWASQRAYIWAPDDKLMRQVIMKIKAEQAPYLPPPPPSPPGPGGGGGPRAINPLASAANAARAAELDGEELTRERTAVLQEAIDRRDLTGLLTPVGLEALIREQAASGHAGPASSGPAEPSARTPKQEEMDLRRSIETLARERDRQRGAPETISWGATNKDMIRIFGIGREHADLPTLRRMHAWVLGQDQ